MQRKIYAAIVWLMICLPGRSQDLSQQAAAIKNVGPAIDSLFKKYAEQIHAPGLAYGIVFNGGLVLSGSMGYANMEKKCAASLHSDFRIASMTKSFVAMAILQLRDKGKLQLDEPAWHYIPELKDQKYLTADAAPITIRNLLTHSAGFPEDNPWGDRQLAVSDSAMLAMFTNGISFSTNPGSAYEYSNMGFAMLGHIIKKVSGLTYEQYISENILKPLGMTHTYWEYAKVPEKDLATGYRYVNDQWVPQPMLHDGAYGAMGGLITTIEDFQKYLSFHLASSLASGKAETGPLRRSSVRELQKPWQFAMLNANARGTDGSPCATVAEYGYGLRWLMDCHGKVMIGHSGGLPGFGSNWTIMPAYNIGIISFMNVTYASASMINMHVLDTLIRITGLKPARIPVSVILNERKKQLTELLPDWKDAETKEIFAVNFFHDYFIDSLKKESKELFDKAGRIIRVHELVAENNLRGQFILEGEKASIEVYFTLTPENPAKIQALEMNIVQ